MGSSLVMYEEDSIHHPSGKFYICLEDWISGPANFLDKNIYLNLSRKKGSLEDNLLELHNKNVLNFQNKEDILEFAKLYSNGKFSTLEDFEAGGWGEVNLRGLFEYCKELVLGSLTVGYYASKLDNFPELFLNVGEYIESHLTSFWVEDIGVAYFNVSGFGDLQSFLNFRFGAFLNFERISNAIGFFEEASIGEMIEESLTKLFGNKKDVKFKVEDLGISDPNNLKGRIEQLAKNHDKIPHDLILLERKRGLFADQGFVRNIRLTIYSDYILNYQVQNIIGASTSLFDYRHSVISNYPSAPNEYVYVYTPVTLHDPKKDPCEWVFELPIYADIPALS